MRRCLKNSRQSRTGFTLFEVLLVLGMLIVVGALSWPSIQRSYDGIRLKKTAEQVMAAFGHARVLAMSTGVTQAFRFQPGTGQYTMMTMQDDSQGVDSDASGAGSALVGSALRGASSTTSGGSSDANSNTSDANPSDPNTATMGGSTSSQQTGSCSYKLTDGFVFTKGERTLDTRAAAAESELPSDGSGGTSDNAPPILFYSDGTTSEAVVTVSDKTGRSISVTLRGLTGVARLGDVFTGETPQ